MPTFSIRFVCVNAIFDGGDRATRAEIARVLRDVANIVARGDAAELGGSIRDVNGNTIGTYSFEVTL